MTGSLNITAILVADLMGIVLLTVVASSARWRLREEGSENDALRILVASAFIACLADLIASLCDGRAGAMMFMGVYVGNFLLYALDLIIPQIWVAFLVLHMSGQLPRGQKIFLVSVALLGSAILAVNLFVPIAFSVDSSNTYSRESFFFVLAGLQALVLLDSLYVYAKSARSSAQLRVFPVHYFLAPVILGLLAQALIYGVSTIWPFTAISVCGVIAGLQNEEVFRDQLTGLFNRSYLDRVVGRELQKGKRAYTGIMLDLNNFKSINDTYGHVIGDMALREFSGILGEAIRDKGIAARFAGDEFIIVLATQDEEKVSAFRQNLENRVEESNVGTDRPYTLSVSVGSCKLRNGTTGLAESFDLMDALMYEDKRAYYATQDKQ